MCLIRREEDSTHERKDHVGLLKECAEMYFSPISFIKFPLI